MTSFNQTCPLLKLITHSQNSFDHIHGTACPSPESHRCCGGGRCGSDVFNQYKGAQLRRIQIFEVFATITHIIKFKRHLKQIDSLSFVLLCISIMGNIRNVFCWQQHPYMSFCLTMNTYASFKTSLIISLRYFEMFLINIE